MSNDTMTEFDALIARLSGKTCWSVQVSEVGSLANLHFGEKVRREQVLAYPDFQLDVDERVYHGEIVLYLEECPWRLDGPDAVVCTWMDDSSPEGQLNQGLHQLKGRQVINAHISHPGLDLAIHFDGDFVLRVFPDQVDPDEGDNYAIHNGGMTYVVAAGSTLYSMEENQ